MSFKKNILYFSLYNLNVLFNSLYFYIFFNLRVGEEWWNYSSEYVPPANKKSN